MKWSTINSILAASAVVSAFPAIEKKAVFANPSANGTKFTIDGVTKYFAGSNSYWIGFLTNNADIDLTMSHVASAGLKIFRVWGFNDVNGGGNGVYYQSHSSSGATINTGANGLQRMDVVVAAAEKYKVKLIINFVNFWDDYGGMNAYVKAYGGTKTGWYTNAKAQSVYQAYIKAVVNRYKNSRGMANTDTAAWIKAHADACLAAGKPCLFEEYGVSSNHCATEKPWQAAARSTPGNSADLFWQWGDQLSTGQTHNDGNTIYVGSSDFQCLVTDHVKAIGWNGLRLDLFGLL
ncbi:putative Mannan endo-1,4-beta-mannosidase F [Glarea lozoyensis 74030]|uniref:Putative Mannan endo-1,4-beta-mannosidase F n=1 Tax=Glarea lozoyensis (strain ATCC 74030 / MF5533) TaxID=1104152 RepID=H0EKB9_GLAL7|nr:putative Mannan endo-1,4-beta-mannosidase F [Glarea lozoyensis 74030]